VRKPPAFNALVKRMWVAAREWLMSGLKRVNEVRRSRSCAVRGGGGGGGRQETQSTC